MSHDSVLHFTSYCGFNMRPHDFIFIISIPHWTITLHRFFFILLSLISFDKAFLLFFGEERQINECIDNKTIMVDITFRHNPYQEAWSHVNKCALILFLFGYKKDQWFLAVNPKSCLSYECKAVFICENLYKKKQINECVFEFFSYKI